MKKYIVSFLFLFFVCGLFFYKTFIFGLVPFPGDLLTGEFFPYKTVSYNGYPPGGIPSKAQGSDVIRQLYPWKFFATSQLRQGNIPLWDPYNFSGNPLMANIQSGVFNPLNAIFLLIPFNSAWSVFIFLIPVLSSIFMYMLLRELDSSRESALFGGIVFAFSSYMVVWMEWGNVGHALLWLPLILLLTEKIVKKSDVKNYLFLILSFVFCILSGYVQGYFYITFSSILFFLTRSIQDKTLSWKKSIYFFAGIMLPILISSFQILPSIELFLNSSRNNYSLSDITKILSPIWYSITVLIPDFFGNPATRNYWVGGTYIERVSYFGVIPFVLAIFSLVNFRKNKYGIFFGILFILSFALSLDFFLDRFVYLFPIPFISTTIPTRILSLFVFSGSVLSAFGLDLFLAEKEKKKLYVVIAFLFCIFLIAFLSTFFLRSIDALVSRRNIILPFGLFFSFSILFLLQSFLRKKIKDIVIIIAFVLTIIDLFYFFQKITPFSSQNLIYPKTNIFSFITQKSGYNRVWGYGSGYVQSNIQTYEKLFSTDGYDPLHSLRYGELLSTSINARMPSSIMRSDAVINGGYNSGDDLKNNTYRQTLLNLLGVKYLITKNLNASLPDFYKPVYQENDVIIYENQNSLPRAFLVNKYNLVTQKNKIISQLFSDKLVKNRQKIILEEKPDIQLSNTFDNTSIVKINSYDPNRVIIQTQSKQNSLLFLSDTYYPGWEVLVDNKKSKIYRANYAFRSVALQKGTHTVEFFYYPDSFRLGLELSAFSVVCLILGMLFLSKRGKIGK